MRLPRLTVPLLLLCSLPLQAATLRTQDGLSLSLSGDGKVTGLSASERRLSVPDGGGFYASDCALTAPAARSGLTSAQTPAATTSGPRVYLRAPLSSAKGMLTQQGKLAALGLKLETSGAVSGNYLSFSGKVTDLTGRDRAIEVGYEIPLQARGWTWSDDLVHSRAVVADQTYRSTYDCAAGPGYNQSYPFSSLAEGRTGLSLGVPLAQGPRVYSIEYGGARQCLLIRFHFALSKQVKKLPGQAWFSFLLYQHDGRWGLRSAADRYYHLFPRDFEKRVPREGYLGYAHLETSDGTRGPATFYGVPAFGDFGQGFPWLWHQHSSYGAISYDAEDATPPTDEAALQLLKEAAVAQGLQTKYGWGQAKLDLLGKPRLMQWEEPAWSLLRKLYTDAQGKIVWVGDSAYTPTAGDTPGRWLLNFQLNDDPEVSPALKEGLQAALQQWQAQHPQAGPYEWCLSVDGMGFVGRQLDFRAEHLALSDVPLTYDRETKKPAISDVGWEGNSQVLAPLAKQYKVLMVRNFVSGAPDLGANIPFVDIGLLECEYGKWGWNEDMEVYARTSGYRKVFRTWLHAPEGAQRAQAVHEMFQRSLPYAIYPHLLPDAARYRDLYLKYVPVIERLSAAGWEPVTLARTAEPDVHVERYGRVGDANLAFAARNVGTEAKRVRLVLDERLGLPDEAEKLEVRDLLTGESVAALADGKALALPLTLAPGESVALSVLPHEGQLRADLNNTAGCLRQAAELNTTDEMSYQASRPGELLVGDTPSSVRADTVLTDGWSSYQGLIWKAGEPLTIKLDLNSPHRLKWLRLHYGFGDAYEMPEAKVEGQDRDGNWEALGKLAGGTVAPLLDVKTAGEYQFVRLSWPALTKMLWLKEIEAEGEDAALLRAADRFETLAQRASRGDLGLAGQLAIALRVRRMLGHDKTLQEQALTHLSDFTSTATGVYVSLQLPPNAPPSGSVQANLTVVNRGKDPLHEGSVKLKLPPGWSAAPTKLEVDLPAGQTSRIPLTLVRSTEGGHLTLLVTGSVGTDAIFMSRWL